MADHALRMVSSVPLERRGNVNCIGFSPDGRNYAWGYDNGLIGVQRWRQIPTTIRANADSIFALGWAPDGESFVAGDGRGQLIFVNRSGQFRIEEVHEAPIWSLAFSPNGDFVLSGAADGTIGIFGKAMSYPVLMTGHLDDVTAVAWKPDGRQFASASYDQSVTIWNAPSWEKDAKLQIRSRVLDIDWAPDDRICVALEDGTIALVTLSPFSTRTFEGHTGAVDLVSCFARAPILISDSSDGTIRFWDIRTGGELIALRTEKTVGEISRSTKSDRASRSPTTNSILYPYGLLIAHCFCLSTVTLSHNPVLKWFLSAKAMWENPVWRCASQRTDTRNKVPPMA
jgi:WD40 repeat protein